MTLKPPVSTHFKKTYERAFKYEPKEGHKDSNNNNKLKTDTTIKPKIIQALNKFGLDDAEAEAYIQGYNVKASSNDNDRKKDGSKTAARFALAKIAAAEQYAKGSPGDVPVSPSANKNAGYAMTFGIFWNNLFSVYFLYLMDAHLSNFFMYTDMDERSLMKSINSLKLQICIKHYDVDSIQFFKDFRQL
ncbi:hypothetical protein BdWA1_000780 [Babesia duncani]|uniref:Uncharacterized protein n=1 Tax=Babesia duncani TaxID=323732 RepID=A0AAD9PNR0_9APIC|nr:hypothetical protein BdWA1_000780 [Babesia duncani]